MTEQKDVPPLANVIAGIASFYAPGLGQLVLGRKKDATKALCTALFFWFAAACIIGFTTKPIGIVIGIAVGLIAHIAAASDAALGPKPTRKE